MKMFSDCSGECCVCACAGGCLAGHGDDDFTLASKEQIIKRLDKGQYKDYTELMKATLKYSYNYDYDNPYPARTAHWIIESHGYAGSDYKCSECGDTWNDNYTDIATEDKCPSCGALINDDENEYVEDKKINTKPPVVPTLHLGKFINRSDENVKSIRKYEEMENKLIQVSGFDVEKLIELFSAGYTLQPPNKEFTTFDF